MFPFQSGELSFQISNNNNNNNSDDDDVNYTTNNYRKVEQNLSASSSSNNAFSSQLLEFNNPQGVKYNSIPKSPGKRKLWSGQSLKIPNDNNSNSDINEGKISSSDGAEKKNIHREIERQRRLEMATLYSSLRSTLPVDCIKGKRSISDHIAEATKYIKDLEKNIKELGDKRDQLKASCSSSTLESNLHGDIGCSTSSSTCSSSRNDINFSIHTFSRAIEIEICAGVATHFPLSKVLKVLTKEGLDVASCFSSEVNKRCICVIHCQVEDVTSIDLNQLQCTLNNEIFRNDP